MDRKCQQIEKSLILKIKRANCNDSLIKLTELHVLLCFKIYGRFSSILSNIGFSAEDVMADKYFVTYKAAKKYNFARKVKFCTFLGSYFRFYCLRLINNNNKYLSVDPQEMNIFFDKTPKIDEKHETMDYVFKILSKMKDKRIERIYRLRYLSGGKLNTWREIGRKTGLSTQGVINIYERTRILLKNKLESQSTLDLI